MRGRVVPEPVYSEVNASETARLATVVRTPSIFRCLPAGMLIGLVFLMASQLETKWFYFLFLGALIFAASCAIPDRRAFYLALLVFTISIRIGLNPYFQRSTIHHATHGFLIQLHQLPLAALYFIWFYRSWAAHRPLGISTRGLVPLAAFFGVGVTSVVLGGNLLFGTFDLFALLGSFALFVYTSSDLRGKRDLQIVLTVLLVNVAVQGILAILQHLTRSSLGLNFFGEVSDSKGGSQVWQGLADRTRAGGTIGHPNALALFLDLLLPLGFGLLFTPLRRRTRLFLVGAVGVGMCGLIFTLSRGGFVATGLGCLLIFFLWFGQRFGLLRALCASTLVVAVVLVLAFGTSNPIYARFFQDDYKAAYGRIPLNQVALSLLRSNPFFGVGLNNYNEIAPQYDTTPERITVWWNVPVHNLFLYIAAQTGLIGLTFYLLFLVSVLRSLWPAIRSPDPFLAWASLGVAVGIIAFFAHLQIEFDSVTHNSLFWFLSGLAVSLGRHATDQLAPLAQERPRER